MNYRICKISTKILVLFFNASFSLAQNSIPNKLFNTASGLGPSDIAIIVNDMDPVSRRIGQYYRATRKIPDTNMIHIRFKTKGKMMPPGVFNDINASVKTKTLPSIQAYAITWTQPYRVGCMSITTAFAAGFDPAFCAGKCSATKPNPYYSSNSSKPYTDFGWRPTMALAGRSYDSVVELIDRGAKSDHSFPNGTAYLLSTSDKARNARAPSFPATKQMFNNEWKVEIVEKNFIHAKTDIMFYFAGTKSVKKLETNHFLPGAVADHLTSAGGQLTDSKQMSSLDWIEAGATASYGTVVEPCNFLQKFPDPGILTHHYLRGNTVIEAYWKSVAWPGQGIFIGDPLARPFGSDLSN